MKRKIKNNAFAVQMEQVRYLKKGDFFRLHRLYIYYCVVSCEPYKDAAGKVFMKIIDRDKRQHLLEPDLMVETADVLASIGCSKAQAERFKAAL